MFLPRSCTITHRGNAKPGVRQLTDKKAEVCVVLRGAEKAGGTTGEFTHVVEVPSRLEQYRHVNYRWSG